MKPPFLTGSGRIVPIEDVMHLVRCAKRNIPRMRKQAEEELDADTLEYHNKYQRSKWMRWRKQFYTLDQVKEIVKGDRFYGFDVRCRFDQASDALKGIEGLCTPLFPGSDVFLSNMDINFLRKYAGDTNGD